MMRSLPLARISTLWTPSGRRTLARVVCGRGVSGVGAACAPLALRASAAAGRYSAILLESLADRLAEAFAERMHQRVRREFWGFQPDEQLDNEALIGEKYVGIRPAPGYPACPEHSLKTHLFDLMNVEARAGITLTDSFAMWPTAAVSGFYFAHPESAYFGVARVGPDQLEDYAARLGVSRERATQLLRPNLD